MAEDDLLDAATGSVVVGMDDSKVARSALKYAIDEAVRRGTDVLALSVFHSPSAWAREISTLVDEDRVVGEVQKAAKATVDDVVAEERGRGVEVPTVRVGVRTGTPDDVLCRISRDALMLVVGDRGRGELASRIIGSTVLGVVLNASCPVLVVHPSDR